MDKKKLKALLMNEGFGVEGAEIAINAVWEYLQKSQAEAIKWFADKVKDICRPFPMHDDYECNIIYEKDIDNLVKEMVGADND